MKTKAELRADILASWSRVSSFQEQAALLNRAYVALGEQVPSGFVLVPVEPTDAMKRAGNDALAQHWGAGDAYRAMLAASRLPVQPVQGMSNRSKRLDEIRAEAELFFEWPGDDRSTVTLTSCILFADHIAATSAPAAQDEPAKLRERVAELEKLAEAISNDCNTVANERNDLRAELAALRVQVPVATVTVQHFRQDPSMENVDFQLQVELPQGTHKLYSSPVPAQPAVVMPEPFPIHNNPLSAWDAGYESGYNDALYLVEELLNRGKP